MKWLNKYREELVKTGAIVVVIWALLLVFPGVFAALIHAASGISIKYAFWYDAVQRIVAVSLLTVGFLSVLTLLLRLFDKWDNRFDVSHVDGNPIATAIYAGLTQAGLIIGACLVFAVTVVVVFL